MNEIEIHNLKEKIKLLEEQLQTATEPYLVRQLTMLISEYKEQLHRAGAI